MIDVADETEVIKNRAYTLKIGCYQMTIDCNDDSQELLLIGKNSYTSYAIAV